MALQTAAAENSRSVVRPVRSGSMGRTRKRPKGQGTTIGFRAEDDLVEEIDSEAARHPVPLSRTQMIKLLLREALDARKAKSKP